MVNLYLSAQLRWLVVWKRALCGHRWARIQKAFSAGPAHPGPGKTQLQGIVRSYRRGNGVETRQGVRPRPPANKTWNFRRDKMLIDILLDAPGDMLAEIRRKFGRRSGVRPSIPTVCKAIHRLGFSRKQVTCDARAVRVWSPMSCHFVRSCSATPGDAALALLLPLRTAFVVSQVSSSSSWMRPQRMGAPCAGRWATRCAARLPLRGMACFHAATGSHRFAVLIGMGLSRGNTRAARSIGAASWPPRDESWCAAPLESDASRLVAQARIPPACAVAVHTAVPGPPLHNHSGQRERSQEQSVRPDGAPPGWPRAIHTPLLLGHDPIRQRGVWHGAALAAAPRALGGARGLAACAGQRIC